jgi:hypothetical protein
MILLKRCHVLWHHTADLCTPLVLQDGYRCCGVVVGGGGVQAGNIVAGWTTAVSLVLQVCVECQQILHQEQPIFFLARTATLTLNLSRLCCLPCQT